MLRNRPLLLLLLLLSPFLLDLAAANDSNDVTALRFAFVLEDIQSAFYAAGLQQFSMQDFINSGANVTVYQYVSSIGDQDRMHAQNLSAALDAAGSSAPAACTYRFPTLNSVSDFLVAARQLETNTSRGLLGVLGSFSSVDMLNLVSGIAANDARHLAYLNLITDVVPFPDAIDKPSTPASTLDAIAPYLADCPLPVIPVVRQATTSSAAAAVSSLLLVAAAALLATAL